MLRRLYYLLLGAIAGLIIGIVFGVIVLFISGNPIVAASALIACILVGAATGVILGKKIVLFYDGLLEFFTSEAW